MKHIKTTLDTHQRKKGNLDKEYEIKKKEFKRATWNKREKEKNGRKNERWRTKIKYKHLWSLKRAVAVVVEAKGNDGNYTNNNITEEWIWCNQSEIVMHTHNNKRNTLKVMVQLRERTEAKNLIKIHAHNKITIKI